MVPLTRLQSDRRLRFFLIVLVLVLVFVLVLVLLFVCFLSELRNA